MSNTGNTTTLTFVPDTGTTEWTFDPPLETVDPLEFSVEDIDTSYLGTTNYKTREAADLQDLGDMTVSCQFDGEIDDLSVGQTGTLTLKFPRIGSNATNLVRANVSGTGYLKSFKPEEISNDSKLMATLVFAFDGGTGPTWTAEHYT